MVSFLEKRIKQGLTQQQLANKVGVDRTTVSKWELGKAIPRPPVLKRMAKIFNCTIDELLN